MISLVSTQPLHRRVRPPGRQPLPSPILPIVRRAQSPVWTELGSQRWARKGLDPFLPLVKGIKKSESVPVLLLNNLFIWSVFLRQTGALLQPGEERLASY
jgi:hypothetical protein